MAPRAHRAMEVISTGFMLSLAPRALLTSASQANLTSRPLAKVTHALSIVAQGLNHQFSDKLVEGHGVGQLRALGQQRIVQ